MSKLEDDFTWYNVVGVGSEGVEMLVSSQDKEFIVERHNIMELRARFNNHKNIKIYIWQSREETTFELLEKRPELLILVKQTARKDYL